MQGGALPELCHTRLMGFTVKIWYLAWKLNFHNRFPTEDTLEITSSTSLFTFCWLSEKLYEKKSYNDKWNDLKQLEAQILRILRVKYYNVIKNISKWQISYAFFLIHLLSSGVPRMNPPPPFKPLLWIPLPYTNHSFVFTTLHLCADPDDP